MAELPQGWRLTTFRKLGWSDVLGLDDDALAFKGGTTWVSLRSTGLVTMQGNPRAWPRVGLRARTGLAILSPTSVWSL
jgi:hypothetical protein